MVDKDLKPCPFCGESGYLGIAFAQKVYSDDSFVRCHNCGASGPPSGISDAQARKLWNERKEEKEHP